MDPVDNNDGEDFDTALTFSSSAIVEPLSWPRRAYTSFIWWASAGERRDGLSEEEEEEEEEQDARFLSDVLLTGQQQQRASSTESPEIALVAYFHRFTAQLFAGVSDAIARHDDGQENNNNVNGSEDSLNDDDTLVVTGHFAGGDDSDRAPLLRRTSGQQPRSQQRKQATAQESPVKISSSDMIKMGLDAWSAADRGFVQQFVSLWWGREAQVDGARVTCCGIPIL